MLTPMNDFTKKFTDVAGDYLSKDVVDIKDYLDSSPRELRDYINNTLIAILNSIVSGSSGAENIGSTDIAGIAGNTVYDQIVSLLSLEQSDKAYVMTQISNIVLGQVPDGSITDVKLSNSAGMIKSQITDITNKFKRRQMGVRI